MILRDPSPLVLRARSEESRDAKPSPPGVAHNKHSVTGLCIVHSQHLLGISCIPGSVLGSGEAAVNKAEGFLEALHFRRTMLSHIGTADQIQDVSAYKSVTVKQVTSLTSPPANFPAPSLCSPHTDLPQPLKHPQNDPTSGQLQFSLPAAFFPPGSCMASFLLTQFSLMSLPQRGL